MAHDCVVNTMDYSEFITQNMHAILLSLVPGLPLLLALACCLRPPETHRLLPWAAVPALITPFIVPREVVVTVGWFFMGGHMGLDALGQIFLCTSAFIWLLAALSVRAGLASAPHGPRFSGFFLVAMAGNFGLVLALDMLGFYLFFALMSLASYVLVIHRNTSEARASGRIYLVLVITGEVALFTGLLLLAGSSRSMAIADIAWDSFHPAALVLLFISFGIKIGALPFHFWMPRAYCSAPLPAAAALAGAMVNAGLLGWLRFLPLGKSALPQGAALFIIAGALAAIHGVIAGLGGKNARSVLAYSSISQMGLMTIIAGLGLLSPDAGQQAVVVLTIYAVHHGLAKGSLFFGLYRISDPSGKISQLRIAGLLLPALALAGFPLTSGAIAKTGFKELAAGAGAPWQQSLEIFFPMASIGTTLLVLHFIRLLARAESEENFDQGSRLTWLISLAGVATGTWLLPLAAQFASHSLEPAKLWQSLWPVMVGISIAVPLDKIMGRRQSMYTLPAADLGVLSARLNDLYQRALSSTKMKTEWLRPGNWQGLMTISTLSPQMRKAENILKRWEVVGLCYVAVCGLLLFLLSY